MHWAIAVQLCRAVQDRQLTPSCHRGTCLPRRRSGLPRSSVPQTPPAGLGGSLGPGDKPRDDTRWLVSSIPAGVLAYIAARGNFAAGSDTAALGYLFIANT